MSMDRTNADRVSAAEVAICSHHGGNEEEDKTHLSDLLCDLHHWADSHGVTFENAAAMAAMHYTAECEEELQDRIREEEGDACGLLTPCKLMRTKLTLLFNDADACWNDWAPAYLIDRVIAAAETASEDGKHEFITQLRVWERDYQTRLVPMQPLGIRVSEEKIYRAAYMDHLKVLHHLVRSLLADIGIFEKDDAASNTSSHNPKSEKPVG